MTSETAGRDPQLGKEPISMQAQQTKVCEAAESEIAASMPVADPVAADACWEVLVDDTGEWKLARGARGGAPDFARLARATVSPMTTLGSVAFYRTYAREREGRRETWAEMNERVVRACNEQFGCGFTQREQERFFELCHGLRCALGGRFLWQAGTSTVARFGLGSMQNCASTAMDAPIEPFCWTFMMLMLGAGVGFHLGAEHVDKLPLARRVRVQRDDGDPDAYQVGDSREGWVDALRTLLSLHFAPPAPCTAPSLPSAALAEPSAAEPKHETGTKETKAEVGAVASGVRWVYSCARVRPRGTKLRAFGGTASGPDALEEGLAGINAVLNAAAVRADARVRSVDVLDIQNLIGGIVAAGNVRRAAQIAVGDATDLGFLRAKRWDLSAVPKHRFMSNNSVAVDDITTLLDNEDFWAGYEGRGEPYGLVNLPLARSCGRLGERQYADPRVACPNPCAEIFLERWETCCLAEIFLPSIASAHELTEAMLLLYRACKHSLRLPCQLKQTEEVVHRNARIGISVTGYMQATEEQRRWLPAAYVRLRAFDAEYSALRGFPRSIKLTTVKPSGTLSLLAGVTSGVHAAYSPYYMRTVRIDASSELIPALRTAGHKVEQELLPNKEGKLVENPATCVAYFPTDASSAVSAEQLSAVQQLEVVRRLQTDWSDNAVSCTVTFKPAELPDIKAWLRAHYRTCIKSVSFLLHSGHGFVQAPIQPLSRDEYLAAAARLRPIDFAALRPTSLERDLALVQAEACASASCPIR